MKSESQGSTSRGNGEAVGAAPHILFDNNLLSLCSFVSFVMSDKVLIISSTLHIILIKS